MWRAQLSTAAPAGPAFYCSPGIETMHARSTLCKNTVAVGCAVIGEAQPCHVHSAVLQTGALDTVDPSAVLQAPLHLAAISLSSPPPAHLHLLVASRAHPGLPTHLPLIQTSCKVRLVRLAQGVMPLHVVLTLLPFKLCPSTMGKA
jgi:hypothetical protein